MTLVDLEKFARSLIAEGLSVGLVVVFAILYALLRPNDAKIVAGWLMSGLAKVFHQLDKRAVALKVEGEINRARSRILKDAPNVIRGDLKLRFARVDEAASIIRGGNVVVIMRRSNHHEENVAHALMAYLPRSVVPIARPYIAPETMRAVDLTLAKAILSRDTNPSGALNFFLEQHMEPARKSSRRLSDQLVAMDEIDLHGWLSRVLLVEYARLGAIMYPGAQDDRFTLEADEFMRWLHKLARPENDGSLQYRGRFFRVAVVFVAARYKLLQGGLAPYRNRVITLLYRRDYHAVYLMARDDNIAAAADLEAELSRDGLVSDVQSFEYELRADFAAKRFKRKRAICIRLCKRLDIGTADVADDIGLPSDEYESAVQASPPTDTTFPIVVERGTVSELERTRRFGFIAGEKGRLFFHSSQLVDAEFKELKTGQPVLFRRGFDAKRGRPQAELVKLLPDPEKPRK